MTGNKNAWRAPLAGLASVAMLATMGVTALGANADTTSWTVSQNAWVNESVLDDAVRGGASFTDVPEFGYVNAKNKTVKVDALASEHEGESLSARTYADASVTLHFSGTEMIVDGVESSSFEVKVPVNGTLADYHTIVDSADGKYVNEWKVLGQSAGDKTVYFTGTLEDLLTETSLASEDHAGWGFDVKPVQVKDTATVQFNRPADWSTAIAHLTNSYADGNTLVGSYFADVDPLTHQAKAPKMAYDTAANPSPSILTGYTDATGKFVAPGEVFTAYHDMAVDPASDNSVIVSFDSKGGSDVAAQMVKEDNTVSEPTAPTRDNYVFTGWKLPASAVEGVAYRLNAKGAVKGGYVLDFTAVQFLEPVTLEAQWTVSRDVKVTFDYGNYPGAPADKSDTYKPTDLVKAPEAPTRDGFYFGGWKTADIARVNFNTTIAASLNKGANVTLHAVWTRLSQKNAQDAIDYVKPADAGFFTSKSFDAFKTVWQKANAENAAANWGALNGEQAADKAQAIIDELEAAWKDLRFNTADVDTTIDGKYQGSKDSTTGAEMVYRLATPDGKHHFMTADENEVLARTNTNYGQGGWKLESAASFRMINKKVTTVEDRNWVRSSNPDAGSSAVDYGDGAGADITYTPSKLVNEVTRLYNPLLQEHLYTTDPVEVKSLTAGDWSADSTNASLYTPALYTTKTPVVRFYSPVTKLHFYTADSNEIATWNQHPGVWNNEGNKLYAL